MPSTRSIPTGRRTPTASRPPARKASSTTTARWAAGWRSRMLPAPATWSRCCVSSLKRRFAMSCASPCPPTCRAPSRPATPTTTTKHGRPPLKRPCCGARSSGARADRGWRTSSARSERAGRWRSARSSAGQLKRAQQRERAALGERFVEVPALRRLHAGGAAVGARAALKQLCCALAELLEALEGGLRQPHATGVAVVEEDRRTAGLRVGVGGEPADVATVAERKQRHDRDLCVLERV